MVENREPWGAHEQESNKMKVCSSKVMCWWRIKDTEKGSEGEKGDNIQ